jgi:hypothetical protein
VERVGKPKPEKANILFQLVAKIYMWSQNVQLQTIQEFAMGNKKDFLDGW